MSAWVSRNFTLVWVGLVGFAMIQTWLFGFEAMRGTWAMLGCMLLVCILGTLRDLRDTLSAEPDE